MTGALWSTRRRALMRRGGVLGALLVAASTFFIACGDAQPPTRPNIVLIIGDDHGYTDFGFMGSTSAKTPNLDRLASEGTVFTHGYSTASVCRPALQSLLTGLHPHQWNLRLAAMRRQGTRLQRWREIPHFETLPRQLSKAGYASFQAGKQFEGTFEMAGFTHGMSSTKDYRKLSGVMGGTSLEIMRKTMDPVYEFIDARAEQPFFIWLAPLLPHTPHDASKEYRDRYADQTLAPHEVMYLANVSRFDDGVGALMDYLDRKGLRKKTLVVYLADNGWQPSAHGMVGGAKGKMSLFELGFRTPIIFSWPGHVPAGASSDALVSIVDLFATFLDYAGLSQLPNRSGRSVKPLLEGEATEIRDAVIGSMQRVRHPTEARAGKGSTGGSFLRNRDWHYLLYDDGTELLFDMNRDPEESRSVVAHHPELANRFRREIEAWKTRMERSMEARSSDADVSGDLQRPASPRAAAHLTL